MQQEEEEVKSGARREQVEQDKSHTKARVEALGDLAVMLFDKHQETLQIIKEKDAIIAEANG